MYVFSVVFGLSSSINQCPQEVSNRERHGWFAVLYFQIECMKRVCKFLNNPDIFPVHWTTACCITRRPGTFQNQVGEGQNVPKSTWKRPRGRSTEKWSSAQGKICTSVLRWKHIVPRSYDHLSVPLRLSGDIEITFTLAPG